MTLLSTRWRTFIECTYIKIRLRFHEGFQPIVFIILLRFLTAQGGMVL